jgi:predicted RNA-binding protein Jag
MEANKERFIDIEANSVEEAIEMGIRKLNLPREKIKLKILSEPHAGLFGMDGPSKAKIRIIY